MTDSKKLTNMVLPINLTFFNTSSSATANFFIPFAVKRIKYISSTWYTSNGFLTGTLSTSLYLRSSTIPKADYLAMLGPININNSHSLEIVYPSPIEIRGDQTFELMDYGSVHTMDKDILVSVVLSFEQE